MNGRAYSTFDTGTVRVNSITRANLSPVAEAYGKIHAAVTVAKVGHLRLRYGVSVLYI